MPTYEYTCTCGKTHERVYGFHAKKPLAISCSCGKKAKRKFSMSVHYVGTGWTKGGVQDAK